MAFWGNGNLFQTWERKAITMRGKVSGPCGGKGVPKLLSSSELRGEYKERRPLAQQSAYSQVSEAPRRGMIGESLLAEGKPSLECPIMTQAEEPSGATLLEEPSFRKRKHLRARCGRVASMRQIQEKRTGRTTLILRPRRKQWKEKMDPRAVLRARARPLLVEAVCF